MPQTFDLVLKGGTLVNQDGRGERDVGVKDGTIVRVGDLSGASAGQVVDCNGLHILPGVIDTQVHFREPGLDHKEDLASGGAAAVAGGVTTVFEMPNTKPLTTTPEALADKLERARGRMRCDHAFFVGAAADTAADLAADVVGSLAGAGLFVATGGLDDERERGA